MITLTGPTGGIGRHVLSALVERDEPLRIVSRNPQNVPEHIRRRVEVVEGSHADPAVMDQALRGARALFWLVNGDPSAHDPFEAYVGFSVPAAAAIVRHDVQHVVSVSALGRGVQRYTGYVSGSLAMDDLLCSTGTHFRALAAPSLMDNLLRDVPSLRQGVLNGVGPADFRSPMVARRDIASVAVDLLGDRSWSGQNDLPVLGPEDLSYDDVSRILGEVLQRPVRYVRHTPEAAEKTMIEFGVTPGMAKAVTAMTLAKMDGLDSLVLPDRASQTPTTLRRWSEEELKPVVDAL